VRAAGRDADDGRCLRAAIVRARLVAHVARRKLAAAEEQRGQTEVSPFGRALIGHATCS
jgi:hypothetical protein